MHTSNYWQRIGLLSYLHQRLNDFATHLIAFFDLSSELIDAQQQKSPNREIGAANYFGTA
jgi:hypothetical protein